MMAKKKSTGQLTYEEAFQELDSIVLQLEGGDLPLEESLKLFERGQELAARCNDLLEKAELKLSKLVPDEAGEIKAVEFSPELE
jgi:exodeoxyribonuclease VII small subunit